VYIEFVNVRDHGTIDSLAKHTPHDVVNLATADFQWFTHQKQQISKKWYYAA